MIQGKPTQRGLGFDWVGFLLLCISALLLAGCGGSTSDPGFPAQQAITPTAGVVEGRAAFPNNVNLD